MRVKAKVLLATATTVWVLPCAAQDAAKIAAFVNAALESRSREIVAVTVQMPADRFSFRPPSEDMTFSQLTLHVADTNYLYCSTIGGTPNPTLAKIADIAPKNTIVERLRASFDFCARTLARLPELDKSETLQIGETKTSRAMAILSLTGTWTDHAAAQVRYLDQNASPSQAARN